MSLYLSLRSPIPFDKCPLGVNLKVVLHISSINLPTTFVTNIDPMLTRGKTLNLKPKAFTTTSSLLIVPKKYGESCVHFEWRHDIKDEYKALMRNKTCIL